MVENKARGTKEMTACGVALVYSRLGTGFPKLPLEESVKTRQRSFFYVKNMDPTLDLINLPPFTNWSPIAWLHWRENPQQAVEVVNQAADWLQVLTGAEGLKGVDIITTMTVRRILPL